MSVVWEVPVVSRDEGLSRRLLRTRTAPVLPRDARPSRSRRERIPLPLRVWGAASRKR